MLLPEPEHRHYPTRAARLTPGSESKNPPSGRNDFLLLSSCVTVTFRDSDPESPHEEKGYHNTSGNTTLWDICKGEKVERILKEKVKGSSIIVFNNHSGFPMIHLISSRQQLRAGKMKKVRVHKLGGGVSSPNRGSAGSQEREDKCVPSSPALARQQLPGG